MKNKYNISNFKEYIQNGGEFSKYFFDFNKDYKKAKKEGKIDEDTMTYLVDFWRDLDACLDGDLGNLLYEVFDGKRPVLVKDIVEFTPKHMEILYNKALDRLDEYEKKEAKSLFDAIWSQNARFEGNYSFYDWDQDSFADVSIEVPRKNRDSYELDFKRICADVIYNRGNMFLKFYARRGGYNLVAISVNDGRGSWRCLSENEILENYTSNDDCPLEIQENEIVVQFKKEKSEEESNVLYFRK